MDSPTHRLCAGGLRIQKGLTRECVTRLARNMTMKMRIAGIRADGAKSGIDYDPHAPGREKCLAVLYQGERAIEKIRERLGATRPSDAVPGSVRSDFGRDLMRNAAHASDSPENAERERRIVGLWREEGPSEVKQIIDRYLAATA